MCCQTYWSITPGFYSWDTLEWSEWDQMGFWPQCRMLKFLNCLNDCSFWNLHLWWSSYINHCFKRCTWRYQGKLASPDPRTSWPSPLDKLTIPPGQVDHPPEQADHPPGQEKPSPLHKLTIPLDRLTIHWSSPWTSWPSPWTSWPSPLDKLTILLDMLAIPPRALSTSHKVVAKTVDPLKARFLYRIQNPLILRTTQAISREVF